MNPLLYRAIWKTKKHLADRQFIEQAKQLERQQLYSQEQLQDLQLKKLQNLVGYAFEKVPFYQKKFNSINFNPNDLKTLEDFSKLPILTKDNIRMHFEELRAIGFPHSKTRTSFTGGSTGVPLKILHDKSIVALSANQYRFYNWIGIKPGNKIAHIWGLNKANEGQIYSNQSKWGRFRSNQVILDAFDMDISKMKSFANLLQNFRPDVVISYVTALYEFALFLKKENITNINPKAIVLTAERTHKYQQQLINEVFSCPIYDLYGSCEVYWYAGESKLKEGLHIFADLRYIEFLGANSQPTQLNQDGRIIVTDLENYAFPLIRYENGDEGSLTKHQGSGMIKFPVMNPVKGRISDTIVLPNGRLVHGEYFTHVFYDFANTIEKFQIHQKSINIIDVNLIAKTPVAKDEILDDLMKHFNEVIQPGLTINYRFVDNIPAEKSGKYRFVKSDVKQR